MKLGAICFTPGGARLCVRLLDALALAGHTCAGWAPKHVIETSGCRDLMPLRGSVKDCAGELFETRDGLIFIGAAGIALRAAAPWIRDKTEDPAVLVMDEAGRYVIPLLSGHVGGANELAETIADLTGAVPVITTATDVRGAFAVDVFARRCGLALSDRETAKRISADLLEEQSVGFFSDFPVNVSGDWPRGLAEDEGCPRNIWITIKSREAEIPGLKGRGREGIEVLRLVPRILVLGIGCRRGTDEDRIAEAVDHVLSEAHIDPACMAAVATIDLKKDEAGLRDFAVHRGLSFLVYPAGALERLPGTFSGSEFVKEVTGVDNVCERAAAAAVLDAGGRLIVRKQAEGGVTVAAAIKQFEVSI